MFSQLLKVYPGQELDKALKTVDSNVMSPRTRLKPILCYAYDVGVGVMYYPFVKLQRGINGTDREKFRYYAQGIFNTRMKGQPLESVDPLAIYERMVKGDFRSGRLLEAETYDAGEQPKTRREERPPTDYSTESSIMVGCSY